MKEYKKRAKTFTIKKNKTDIPSIKVSGSIDAYEYLTRYLFDDSIGVYESFWLLLLNRNNNITGFVKISQGGVSGTVIDVKLIAKYAIDELSDSVIIAHNHPSGNTSPSQADIDVTKKIKAALKLFDIRVLDHLIVSEEKYYSFTDEGLLG